MEELLVKISAMDAVAIVAVPAAIFNFSLYTPYVVKKISAKLQRWY
jgi:hypothetical protein